MIYHRQHSYASRDRLAIPPSEHSPSDRQAVCGRSACARGSTAMHAAAPALQPRGAGPDQGDLGNQWPKLCRYVENETWPICNNACENSTRPFVVGRKNWLFSDTVAGAKASLNLYSLIETCKANDVDVYRYLVDLFKALPYAKTADEYESLLPWKPVSLLESQPPERSPPSRYGAKCEFADRLRSFRTPLSTLAFRDFTERLIVSSKTFVWGERI